MCAGDWWAGASFSNRRFDSCLPLFALGIAAALEWLVAAVARWPLLVTTLALAPLALWNLAGVVVGPDAAAGGPRPFPSQVGDYARAVSRTVGSPTTWPASWLFALSHRVTPNRYDRLSGRYLFYRQNNLGGKIDLGTAGDSVMLDGAWGEPADDGGVSRRSLRGRGRVFAPLDVPERLILRIRARATPSEVALDVRVNGTAVGRATLGPDWRDHEFEAPSERWRRETNEVTFDVQDGAASAEIDRIEFVREAP